MANIRRESNTIQNFNKTLTFETILLGFRDGSHEWIQYKALAFPMIYNRLTVWNELYFVGGLFMDIFKRVGDYPIPQHIKPIFSKGKLKKV